jgi:hypothetical protein
VTEARRDGWGPFVVLGFLWGGVGRLNGSAGPINLCRELPLGPT